MARVVASAVPSLGETVHFRSIDIGQAENEVMQLYFRFGDRCS